MWGDYRGGEGMEEETDFALIAFIMFEFVTRARIIFVIRNKD